MVFGVDAGFFLGGDDGGGMPRGLLRNLFILWSREMESISVC